MLKILGYCDRLSVAPGETVRFMVSCTGGERYRAEIVRIIHGDANPAGPGLKLERIATPVSGDYPAREQKIDAGSYVLVPDHERLRALASFTVIAMIWPTTPPGVARASSPSGRPRAAPASRSRSSMASWPSPSVTAGAVGPRSRAAASF